jgi:hypothetical protein
MALRRVHKSVQLALARMLTIAIDRWTSTYAKDFATLQGVRVSLGVVWICFLDGLEWCWAFLDSVWLSSLCMHAG